MKKKTLKSPVAKKALKAKAEKQTQDFNTLSQMVKKRLVSKFFDAFLNAPDPDGPEIMKYLKVISAQWKTYCAANRVDAKFANTVEQECMFIIEQYRNELNPKPQIPKADEQTENNPAVEQAGGSQPDPSQSTVPGDEVVQGSGDAQGSGAEDPAK